MKKVYFTRIATYWNNYVLFKEDTKILDFLSVILIH